MEKYIEEFAKQLGKAYQEHRNWELTLKTCPKCQFEAVEKGKCSHCGFRSN